MQPLSRPRQPAGLNSNYSVNRHNTDDTNAFDVRIDHEFQRTTTPLRALQLRRHAKLLSRVRSKATPTAAGSTRATRTCARTGAALELHAHVLAHADQRGALRLQPRAHQPPPAERRRHHGHPAASYGIPGVLQIAGNGGLPYFGIGGLSQLGFERMAGQRALQQHLPAHRQPDEDLRVAHLQGRLRSPDDQASLDRVRPTRAASSTSAAASPPSPNPPMAAPGGRSSCCNPVNCPGRAVDGLGGANSVQRLQVRRRRQRQVLHGRLLPGQLERQPQADLELRRCAGTSSAWWAKQYGAQANFVPGARPRSTSSRPAAKASPPVAVVQDLLAKDGIKLVYSDEWGSRPRQVRRRHNFAPRSDFAYQVTPKLVFRGGYGMFYGAFENRGGYPSLGYNYPFQFDFSFPASNDWTPVTYADGTTGTLERGLWPIPMDPSLVNGTGPESARHRVRLQDPLHAGLQLDLAVRVPAEQLLRSRLCRDSRAGTSRPSPVRTPVADPASRHDPTPYIPWPDFARGQPYARPPQPATTIHCRPSTLSVSATAWTCFSPIPAPRP